MKDILVLISIFLFSITSLQAQVNLEDGLIAFYPFNGNADDESGNQNHANINESATLDFDVDGNANSAYTFDGENDFIQVPNTRDLNFNTGQKFSIAFWVKMPKKQNNTYSTVNDLIAKWSSNSTHPYPYAIRIFNQMDNRNGKIWIGQFDYPCKVYPQVLSDIRINDNNWHHIVITRDETNTLRLFIDDILQDEDDSITTCKISNRSNIFFGLRKKRGGNSQAFTGSMDEIRFYNRDLTLDEINALFKKEIKIDDKGEIEKNNIVIYPNPVFNGRLKIKNTSSSPISNIKIYDATGKFMFETKQVEEINVGSLKTGLFIFKIDFEDNDSIIRKIIIQNEFRV